MPLVDARRPAPMQFGFHNDALDASSPWAPWQPQQQDAQRMPVYDPAFLQGPPSIMSETDGPTPKIKNLDELLKWMHSPIPTIERPMLPSRLPMFARPELRR
jgi:hypothetical protein